MEIHADLKVKLTGCNRKGAIFVSIDSRLGTNIRFIYIIMGTFVQRYTLGNLLISAFPCMPNIC